MPDMSDISAGVRAAQSQLAKMRRERQAIPAVGDCLVRLENDVAANGAIPGMTFKAEPNIWYQVDCFGGYTGLAPLLSITAPSGHVVSQQTASVGVVTLRALVAMGGTGGDVSLSGTGATLRGGRFYMRVTEL